MSYSRPLGNSQPAGKTSIAWLAGFWDGEGSILLQRRTTNRGGNWYCPEMTVYNNDRETVDFIKKILDSRGIKSYIHSRKPKNPKHGEQHQLRIVGLTQTTKLLRLLIPHLITKLGRATLLERFVISRLSSSGNKPYSDSENRIRTQLMKPQRLYARQSSD